MKVKTQPKPNSAWVRSKLRTLEVECPNCGAVIQMEESDDNKIRLDAQNRSVITCPIPSCEEVLILWSNNP